MRPLQDFRNGKPGHYPDQCIYAEFASARFGLAFEEIDGGSGLVFNVASAGLRRQFGGGRCSYFPQNDATAATLAADKYFTGVILARTGVPNLAGDYFFLHDRYRAHRPPGHERADALARLEALGRPAFAKPLQGSRGDFAQPIEDAATLSRYMDAVAQYHDAILLQPRFAGTEYRIFVLDDSILFAARKRPPAIVGDGVRTAGELLAARNRDLAARGLSPSDDPAIRSHSPETVPRAGETLVLPGRMNRSAGGAMTIENPPDAKPAFALAHSAVRALGLRAAAVDLFVDIADDPEPRRIIEINANPAIRLLEDAGRSDLILKIWHHTFSAVGLLDV